jgi:hypothetical protein
MSGRGKASVVVKAPAAAEVPPAVAEEPKAKAPEAMDPAVLANALAAAMFEILSLRKELDEIRKQQTEPVKPKKKSSSKPGLSEEELKKVRSENGKRLAAWRKAQKEAKSASDNESKKSESDSEQNSTKSELEEMD